MPDPTDLLDELESLLEQGDSGVFRHRLEDLREALSHEPPALDPEGARRSTAELRYLSEILLGDAKAAMPPEPAGTGPTRTGYALSGQPASGNACVEPAFAQALASGTGGPQLRDRFGDLWAVDLALWEQLDEDPVGLARRWLCSPGRRLVQQLDVLTTLPNDRPLGAMRRSLADLCAAAGDWRGPTGKPWDGRPRLWRSLHGTTPGEPMRRWQPPDDDPTTLLLLAERPPADFPPSVRHAALGRLLDWAADNVSYVVAGVRRQIRDDLTVRIGLLLQGNQDAEIRFQWQLEELVLRHAGRIARMNSGIESVAAAWCIGRWLYGCLMRSPFFGGDPELLLARLSALLPVEAGDEPPGAADALAPARFRQDSLSLRDVTLATAISNHYYRQGRTVLPMPASVVDALLEMAWRPLRPGESLAERALAEGRNDLGWRAHHIAPPLVARQLLTQLRLSWITKAPQEVRAECVSLFDEDPVRHRWLIIAWNVEGPGDATSHERLAQVVVPMITGDRDTVLEFQEIALVGASVFEALSFVERTQLIRLAMRTEVAWRLGALNAIASGARRSGENVLWLEAMGALMAVCDDQQQKSTTRLAAVSYVIEEVEHAEFSERADILSWLQRLIAEDPFRDHVALRREVSRLLAKHSTPLPPKKQSSR